MNTQVNPIPSGYHSLTPYLIAKDAEAALEFYKKAFNAKELFRMDRDGKIGHCEFQIGDSKMMMADEFPEMHAMAPTGENRAVSILLYVENVDEVFDRAIKLGAKVLRPVKNEFYGDRSGSLQDPFGHHWIISTNIEELSPEELQKRAEKC